MLLKIRTKEMNTKQSVQIKIKQMFHLNSPNIGSKLKIFSIKNNWKNTSKTKNVL